MAQIRFGEEKQETQTPNGPGLMDIPFLIQTLRMDPVLALEELTNRYGDIVDVSIHPEIGGDTYIIRDPDFIEKILVTHQRHFDTPTTDAGGDARLVMGKGLLGSEGKAWMKQTRLITPMFQERAVEKHSELFHEHANTYVDKWIAGKDVFPLLQEMKYMTTGVINHALFDSKLTGKEQRIRDALDVLREGYKNRRGAFLKPPLWLPTPYNLELHSARNELRGVARELMSDYMENPDEYTGFVSHLMKAKDSVTDEKMNQTVVQDNIVGFIIAGHETTAAAFTWAIYLLAKHPEEQRRLRDEVREADIDFSETSFKEVEEKLPSTVNTVKESLRLYPSVPLTGRSPARDVEMDGYVFPRGATLIMSSYLNHRDPGQWDDPLRFNPDRFKKENQDDRHEFAYYPFSAGSHMCTGRAFATHELRVLLAAMMERVWFSFPGDYPEVDVDFAINMQPDKEINIKVDTW